LYEAHQYQLSLRLNCLKSDLELDLMAYHVTVSRRTISCRDMVAY
jgi:hypothetical protein